MKHFLRKRAYTLMDLLSRRTPFAITLNDLNDELKPWLPPTDCRLRPDQHAFEAGRFERANELKAELEDFQRATRRKREAGELPPHKPRWFSRSVDPDTGEVMWQPARRDDGQLEYWTERTRVGTAKLKGEPAEWQDVDQICAFPLTESLSCSSTDDSLPVAVVETEH